MKIGFVGLGQMGKNMALNMAKSKDFELTVFDVSSKNYPEFIAAGAKTADKIRQISECDVVFLSLPNASVVEAVLLGEEGLAHKLSAGKIVVDLSTITYAATLRIHEALVSKGIHFLDAPVSGMESRAKDGTLSVMCGGGKDTFQAVLPYLELIGNNILFMGNPGNGQLTKLINQLLFDINAAALAEILPLAIKMELDPKKIGSIVNSGTGRSYASEFFIPRILKGDFTQGYFLQNAYKDLVSASELSAQKCIPLPVLHAATTTYQMALLQGLGQEDKGAMIQVYEKLLGVQYRAE